MSILVKLNLEAERRRSSLLTHTPDGQDSILSLIFNEKRSRKKRTHTEPNTPKSDDTPTIDLFDKTKKETEKDKFLDIFEKQEKDNADGRAIHRKIGKNTFFVENKDLFEDKVDSEGLLHLCRGLTLESFRENEVIYQKGEKTGDKIYLIYKGEIEVLSVGVDGSLKVEPKQSNFSVMSLSKDNDISPQPRLRRSLLLKPLNLESEMTHDRSTGRKSLNVKALTNANPYLKSFVTKTLSGGEYLGKEVFRKQAEWEETMIAKTETHLLVLNIKDLEHVKCRYDKETIQRLNLILKHLNTSTLNEVEVKNKFFRCMEEKVLSYGEQLFFEGDIDKYFYFLIDGKCEFQKKLKEKMESHHESSSPKSKSQKYVPICIIESGAFLGEEALFNKDIGYEYTVKVTSAKAVLLKFCAPDFKHTFSKDILENIEGSYKDKVKTNQEIYQSICNSLSKRNSRLLTSITLTTKSPTHMSQGSPNLGFGSKWDMVSAIDPQEKELESVSSARRHDGSTTRKFFTQMIPSATDRTPAGIVGERRNSDLTKIKGQVLSFHHQVIVTKQDRIATEEVGSHKGKFWNNDSGHKGTEHDEYGYAKDHDSLAQVVQTVGNRAKKGTDSIKMDDYLNSIEDFEHFSKELQKKKRNSKFLQHIESLKINLKNQEEEKKGTQIRNSRPSFLDSPVLTKDSQEKDIVLLFPAKMKSNDHNQSKSPIRKVSKSVKHSSSKIDLKALRNQFYDSPQSSIRDYLAVYKKAHMHNKLSGRTDPFQTKNNDYTNLIKSKHLPHINKDDNSPQLINAAENDYVRISISKSPKGPLEKATLTRRHEHVVLEPINQKINYGKVGVSKLRLTDRDL